jgi:hypothetical protein
MILMSHITLSGGQFVNDGLRMCDETIIVELGVSSQNLHRGTEENI